MRELIVAEFITLDGVIQAPGGPQEDTDGGFTHGGWTQPYWHDEIGRVSFKPCLRPTPFYWAARPGRSTAAPSNPC